MFGGWTIFVAQVLFGAGLMEVTFFGTSFRPGDDTGRLGFVSFLNLIASIAGAMFLGWWWCAIWAVPFAIRLLVFRGGAHAYEKEPIVPDENYGQFAGFAHTEATPLPEDERLRELVAAGKRQEAKTYAREMMEVARSVGNHARADEYARWLGES